MALPRDINKHWAKPPAPLLSSLPTHQKSALSRIAFTILAEPCAGSDRSYYEQILSHSFWAKDPLQECAAGALEALLLLPTLALSEAGRRCCSWQKLLGCSKPRIPLNSPIIIEFPLGAPPRTPWICETPNNAFARSPTLPDEEEPVTLLPVVGHAEID